MQQVGGLGVGHGVDVNAERRLHHHADDGGEVRVAYEQAVHAVGSEGDLAEGGGEQLLPKLPLDPDRVGVRVTIVQGLEGGNVALVVRAVRSEVFGYRLAAGDNVDLGRECVVAQPLEQERPALRVLKREGIGRRGPYRPRVRPAQQPVLAVGQNSHPNPASLLRLCEVVVQLLHKLWVGIETACRANPSLELDERVERGQVNCTSRPQRRRDLLHDLLALNQLRGNEKVANSARDVRLSHVRLMPAQYLARRLGATGVPVI